MIEIFRSDFTMAFEVSGTELDLNPIDGTEPIPATIVDFMQPIRGQYIKFNVLSYHGYGGGLNDLRAYEAIPEPSPFSMLGPGLLGLIGYAYKRKKS